LKFSSFQRVSVKKTYKTYFSENIIFEKKMNAFNNFSPLDQFNIRNLLSVDGPILAEANISLTNIGLYLTLSSLIVLALTILTNNNEKLASNN